MKVVVAKLLEKQEFSILKNKVFTYLGRTKPAIFDYMAGFYGAPVMGNKTKAQNAYGKNVQFVVMYYYSSEKRIANSVIVIN